MGKLQDLYIKKIINYLDMRGRQMAQFAAFHKETNNDTGNQRDAYGWGVYYNKQLVKIGFPASMSASKPHKDLHGGKSFGREWIVEFLTEDFIPETNGFCLVVANAAYYSVSHEEGSTPTGRKYQIISMIYRQMVQEKGHFKESEIKTFNLGFGGRSGTGRRGRPKGSKNRK